MGSRAGVIKVAARRLGMSVEDYLRQVNAGEKWCCRCGQWRLISLFRRDASRGDGLAASCSPCTYRRTTVGPGKSERIAQRINGLAWCRCCTDWLPLALVQHGLCRLHANEYARIRYATNDRYRRERQQHARARKRGVDPIPPEAQENLLEEFDGQCAYCLAPVTTWDHIIPIRHDGRTEPGNIVPACRRCNCSKNSRDVFDWMMEKGLAGHDRFWETIALQYVP